MKNTVTCKICNLESNYIFSSKIRGKYKINYFHCNNCGFMQTEEPYWLEEAYKEPINLSDTGLLKRNISFSKKVKCLLFTYFEKNSKYLDFAGGYGIFTRLMRDYGFDFYWLDPYTENLFAKEFEYVSGSKIDLITAFEVFEHLYNPCLELNKMMSFSKNILFSTNLLPINIPDPNSWSYYGLEHGQHISFYSKRTLKYIAKKNNLNFNSYNGLHLFSINAMNSIVFKYCMYGEHDLLNIFLKRILKSKTISDSFKVASKIIND